MSMEGLSMLSFGEGFAPRQKEYKRNPYVLDETIPRHKNPNDELNRVTKEQILKHIRRKPESERTVIDYLILASTKLEETLDENPPASYVA